jgi:hypothetical protein
MSKCLPIAGSWSLVLLASLITSGTRAQPAKAPLAYSVTEVNAMFGATMSLKIDRDGDKAVVDETVSSRSAGSPGIHTRSYYDIKNHRSNSVDLNFAKANCSSGTFDDNWFDPFEMPATLMRSFENVQQVGSETVNGFATKVMESSAARPGQKIKVWLDTTSGLIIKAEIDAKTIIEVQQVRLAKPQPHSLRSRQRAPPRHLHLHRGMRLVLEDVCRTFPDWHFEIVHPGWPILGWTSRLTKL